MCTNVDREATRDYRKKLNKTGKGYAWKLVWVNEDKWIPPFRNKRQAGIYQDTFYNKLKENEIDFPQCTRVSDFNYMYTAGVFHCCLTRKLTRQIKKNQIQYEKEYDIGPYQYRVVKVVFDAKDFVCVGEMNYIDQKEWGLPIGKNDSVCITKFKFVK